MTEETNFSAEQLEVQTTIGRVRGTKAKPSAPLLFAGIPYAEPPIGPLRFRRPVPKTPWEGVRDCSTFGAAGPQVFDPSEGQYHEFTGEKNPQNPSAWVGSEDCLTLNIWTNATGEDRKRPVMVWIHGGANWLESSRLDIYHGHHFVERGDVVFVSLNYRLGVFGWLDISALGGNAYAGSHSNGLRDQMMALRWIKDNIARFGGDPDQITLMGESAGSIDISWHLTSGHLHGLARRVVMMSGVAGLLGFSGPLKDGFSDVYGKKTSLEFLDRLGIKTMEEALTLSTAEIMSRVVEVAHSVDMLAVMDSQFWPRVMDGYEQDPFHASLSRDLSGIDVIIGFTGYEMGLWLTWDETLDTHPCSWSAKKIMDFDTKTAEAACDLYNHVFAEDHEGARGLHLMGDSIFAIPSFWLADTFAAQGMRVWMYQFDKETNPRRRALHAADQTYLFGTIETAAGQDLLDGPATSEEDLKKRWRLSHTMQDAFLAYIKDGDPNAHKNPDLPHWPRYTSENREVMSFNTVSRILSDPAGPRRKWWYTHIYAPLFGRKETRV